jgi:hypothetical protein
MSDSQSHKDRSHSKKTSKHRNHSPKSVKHHDKPIKDGKSEKHHNKHHSKHQKDKKRAAFVAQTEKNQRGGPLHFSIGLSDRDSHPLIMSSPDGKEFRVSEEGMYLISFTGEVLAEQDSILSFQSVDFNADVAKLGSHRFSAVSGPRSLVFQTILPMKSGSSFEVNFVGDVHCNSGATLTISRSA